jgi:hypothetical protein
MAANAVAFDLVKPASAAGGMSPRAPRILYGTGTPTGTIEPLKSAEKGSIFISTDQTVGSIWVKVANTGATADWAAGGGSKVYTSPEFNVDAGAGTKVHDIFYCPNAIEILTASLFFTEATDASGAAEATIQLGSTAEGVDLVAAVSIAVSKAIGGTQTLTVAEGTVAAAGFVDIMLTAIAATEAGKFRVVLTYLES